jgi:hypothetical protein
MDNPIAISGQHILLGIRLKNGWFRQDISKAITGRELSKDKFSEG